jgi:GAF domain-containing protein
VHPDLPLQRDLPLTDELAAVSARLSGVLLSTETVERALSLICALAVETVPGSVGAGVTIVDGRGRRTSSGATDARVLQADAQQYDLDEGPCLTAVAARTVVRVDDLATDRRWPRWAAAGAPLGLRSSVSAPLVAADTALGAVKVYGQQPSAFDERSEQLVTMFAAQAAVLVANVLTHRRAESFGEGLRRSVRDRDLVNVARGVLVARERVDEDTAFALLLTRARQEGEAVRVTARRIIDAARRR